MKRLWVIPAVFLVVGMVLCAWVIGRNGREIVDVQIPQPPPPEKVIAADVPENEFTGTIDNPKIRKGEKLAIGDGDKVAVMRLLHEAEIIRTSRAGFGETSERYIARVNREPLALQLVDSQAYQNGGGNAIFQMDDPAQSWPPEKSVTQPMHTSKTILRIEVSKASDIDEWQLKSVSEEYSVKRFIWIKRSNPIYHN